MDRDPFVDRSMLCRVKRVFIAGTVVVGALLPPATVAQSPAHETYPASYTPRQILEDFDLFETAMREAHSGLHVFRTPQEIDVVFAQARERLSPATTEAELYLAMSEVVAEVRDGHTSVMLSRGSQAFMFAQPTFLPFRLSFIDGRTYLHLDYSEGHGDLLGSEVRAINGRSMSEILEEMKRYTRSDGRSATGKMQSLAGTANFGRLYQLLFGPTGEFRLDLTLLGGAGEKTLTVPALDESTLNERFGSRYADLSDVAPFELTFVDDPASTAVIRIDQFFGDDLPGFIDDAFGQIAERRIDNLIIDLRGNGGGIESYGQRLVSYLVDQPFIFYDRVVVNARRFDVQKFSNQPDMYYEDEEVDPGPDGTFLITPEYYGFLAEQPPLQPRFEGSVYVLIDGGAFSTTTDTCTALHRLTDTVFIGEEAGGSYYGNTSGSNITVTLPHTKARARIPLERFYAAASGYEPADRGLMPHHEVSPAPRDLTDGTDAVLDYAFDRIRGAATD